MFHLSCSVSVKRRRQNFVPDDQKSEYVVDVFLFLDTARAKLRGTAGPGSALQF